MTDLLRYFSDRTESMIERLERLVRFESPTSSKEHVDILGDYLTAWCRENGADVQIFEQPDVGNLRLATWNNDAPGKPIMFLCHMDTVWPVGTLDTMPIRREGNLIFGPGALDMKGGIVVATQAIQGLRERGELPDRPIWILFTGDEETGSMNTRHKICETAAQAGLVLVMEPAAQGESLKTWRKGMARYIVHTVGRASHAGNAPEAGINAVIEAAHQALYLHGLNDLPNGTSVSVNLIHGGIASNVIAPEATMEVDVRFLKASEAERIDQAITNLMPVLPGAQLVIEGGLDRGPMERDERMIRLFKQALAIGQSLGMEFGEDGSGGGSDGNFTAAMGIPTLDGLGPGGIGLHATHEQVTIPTLPRRAALLAKLLCEWDMETM